MKFAKKNIFLRSILLLFLLNQGVAQEILLDKSSKIPMNITAFMEVFKDSTAQIPFEEIASQKFIKPQKKYFIFPYSNNAYWIKLSIKNINSENKKWILKWDNPLIEELDCYVSDTLKKNFEHTHQKLLTSQKAKKLIEEEHTFDVELLSNSSKIIYFKLKNQRGIYGGLSLHSEASYINFKYDNFAEQSFINGLIVFRLFLVLILGLFIIKDLPFRLYSFQVILKTLAYWGIMNITGAILSSNPDVAKKIDFLSYNSIPIGSGLFVLSIFQWKRLPKWTSFVIYATIAFTIIDDIAACFDYQWYWLKAGLYNIVFSSSFIVLIYGYCFYKKIRVQIYYSIPFILGLFSYLLIYLRLLGWLEFKPLFAISSLLFVAEIFVFVIFLGQIFRNVELNKLKAEQSLNFNIIQNERLKELDNLKTTFFTNISHELRTPLTLITGPIQELLIKYPTDKLLPLMQRNTQRLLTLINQLLDISKLEAGQMKPEITKTELVKYLRTLVSSFTSLAESRHIDFECSQNQTEVFGYIDKDKIDKIITNLLSNAFKFSQNNTKVSVDIQYAADLKSMKIAITDEGIGISKNKIDKIFDRFYQVEPSQNRKYEGTGIGLALVRELVMVLKGEINVESEENVGTKFNIQLPIDLATWKDNLTAEVEVTTHTIQPNLDLKNTILPSNSDEILLIVDDNADIRAYIRSIFEANYKVIEATNGQEGVEKALEFVPDLIISDLMMPMVDGFEFCKILKSNEKTSHVPIIMLTAKAGIENRIEGFELGADDYLIKPFNANEIKARVKNLLEKQARLREYFSGKAKPNDLKVNAMETAFFEKSKEILEKYLADNSFTADKFSQEMNMSQSQLLRKLKALTNLTINEFIRDFRLQRAADLLSKKTATVSEIAYRVGFESLSYFSKTFQEKYGKLPSEYA